MRLLSSWLRGSLLKKIVYSFLLLTVACTCCFALFSLIHSHVSPTAHRLIVRSRLVRPLTVITMAFGSTYDRANILEHNCAMVSSSLHRFIVYTEHTDARFCRKCTCRRLHRARCKCPDPSKPQCNLCEKLRFIISRIAEHSEFLFLDSDLIILKESFLDRLSVRTVAHDALAAYAPVDPNPKKIHATINSGLLFLRRLPGVNYESMWTRMYHLKINDDQLHLSDLIFNNYDNWDSLSVRWHCRFLQREGYDIHPRDCYTIHDRGATDDILKQLNMTLRKLP